MTNTVLPDPLVPTEAAELAWALYETQKAEFLADHPDATPDQIEEHCKRIAREEGL